MDNEFKNYQSVQGFKVEARQVKEDEYFENKLVHQGDWIIRWRCQNYTVPTELFPMLFERKYSSLEEACQENGVANAGGD
jgi:hypothetical protein